MRYIEIKLDGTSIQMEPVTIRQYNNLVDTVVVQLKSDMDGLVVADYNVFVQTDLIRRDKIPLAPCRSSVDIVVEEGYLGYTWTIDAAVTRYKGILLFEVQLEHKTDAAIPIWQSEVCELITVAPNICDNTALGDDGPAILQEVYQQLQMLDDRAEQAAASAADASESKRLAATHERTAKSHAEQTGEDRIATGEDRVATGADRTAVNAALNKLVNLDVSAETLAPGSNATVSKTETETGYTLAFGVPRGDKGEQGEQGDRGATGERGLKGDKGDTGDVSAAQMDAAISAAIVPVTSQLADIASDVRRIDNALETDKTLTVSGTAADAKVTGDKVSELKSAIDNIEDVTVTKIVTTETTDITSTLTYTDGYCNESGETAASTTYKYTNKITVNEGDVIASGSNSYNLRYVTAYNGNTPVVAKGSDATATYTVPSGIDSVVVTIYSAVGTTSGAVLLTETDVTYKNILDDTVYELDNRLDTVESLTIVEEEKAVVTDLSSSPFTEGYVTTTGVIGSSSSYEYSNPIPVSEGDIISTDNGSYRLRYIIAYYNNSVVSAKSAENTLTYTVPSEVDSVIVTVYAATGLVAGTVKKTVTTTEAHNIKDEIISEIKYNTIYDKLTDNDITSSLTFTDGYVNKQGQVISGSTTYKYSTNIDVSEGDILSTSIYLFRYVTAYNGATAVEAKSAEDVISYVVPSGVNKVIVTMYIASTSGVIKSYKGPYSLFYGTLSQKNVGPFEKPYICLSCDDGVDELATYTIPMIISKGVPCTFGLYKTSPVFQHGHTQNVVYAVNNNNCDIAQHGGQHSWTDFSPSELVSFFDDEELFWKSIGVNVKSAIYPTHLSNPMVRAITGSRFGCCRSGYNYDGILYYDDESKAPGTLPYYGTGPRSNLYAMSSWNMPAGKDLPFAKACIDWAIANNKLIHFYWHDWDLDATSKQVLEDAIDYAKTQNITFVKLSDIPTLR